MRYTTITLSLILATASCISSTTAGAQKQRKFSLEASYGLGLNFFVRSYDEQGGPGNRTAYFNKNLVGNASGLALQFQFDERSTVGAGYTHTVNSREISYNGVFNATNLYIGNFTIRHINHYFELYYDRVLVKRLSGLSVQLGLFYLRPVQQEVELANYSNTIAIEERKFKNNRMEEGGAFFSAEYAVPIDTKFELGIRSRLYFLISTGTFEALTVTPTLRFRF